ncbi:hypothetical protein C440_16409 [Haloferax mucosum ATCC BAA-1512]|uniref:Uncharacterized protein n=1 Tax=Haloferax mucosum ATCC BAA-1512 TaxID=662479 RepID=M0I7E2_9EURY|nr:hypothetical protein [Haloferax mucosum]ELZ91912.1 hypothetical protein C440_16409 [Haloferax mucosum ATCC BAA-1512]
MEDELQQRLDGLTLLIMVLFAIEGYQIGGLVGLVLALLFGGGIVHVFIPSSSL